VTSRGKVFGEARQRRQLELFDECTVGRLLVEHRSRLTTVSSVSASCLFEEAEYRIPIQLTVFLHQLGLVIDCHLYH